MFSTLEDLAVGLHISEYSRTSNVGRFLKSDESCGDTLYFEGTVQFALLNLIKVQLYIKDEIPLSSS